MRDSDHRKKKAILKLWLIYIPLAFGKFIFTIIVDYLKNKDFAFEKELIYLFSFVCFPLTKQTKINVLLICLKS
jgi:hypothetical protein